MNLKIEYQQALKLSVSELKSIIIEEGIKTFRHIISKYKQADVYFLALYNVNNYKYIPTFATEQGLAEVAYNFQENSKFSFEEEKRSLRWNLSDSPHHEVENLEELMPETKEKFNEYWIAVKDAISKSELLTSKNIQEYLAFDDVLYNRLRSEMHEMMIEAINEIRNDQVVAEFLETTNCVIGLASEGQSYEELLEDLKLTNPEDRLEQLKSDISFCNKNKKKSKASRAAYKKRNMVQIPETDQLNLKISELKSTLISEGTVAFQHLIEKYGKSNMYYLALYYSAGSYSYILPSFATEKGLLKVAKEVAKNSKTSIEEEVRDLRWSLPDSPHHDSEELEMLMPETENILMEITAIKDSISFKYFDLISEGKVDEDQFYEKTNQAIHQAMIDAINEIQNDQLVAEFIQKTGCVVGIAAGDQDFDDMIKDLRQTNPADRLVQLEADIAHFYQKESDFMPSKDENLEENPGSKIDADQKIRQKIAELKVAIIDEGTKAFQHLISEYERFNIYYLALYYSAGSYSYIIPSFASEEGLEKIAGEYMKHSPYTLEQQKRTLRWILPDSPHHADEKLETLMPETDRLTTELNDLIEDIIYIQQDVILGEGIDDWDWEDEDQFYEETYKSIHLAMLEAVNEIRNDQIVAQFLERTGCVFGMAAGDQSYEDLLEDLRQTNPAERLVQLEEDIAYYNEHSDEMADMMDEYIATTSESMPETSLTLEDFSGTIDAFNPEFVEENDSIFLDNPEEDRRFYGSMAEYSHNRIKLMDLLSVSPHYPELDKLFGHFIGKNFTKEDLLPQIAEQIVEKLEAKLKSQFPDKSFYIYSIVDRNSLYYITFYQNRQDGFFPELKLTNSPLTMAGARIMKVVGTKSATLKLPCCLFISEGRFYAIMHGIYFQKIYTEKTGDSRAIVADSVISYDDALQKLKEVIEDQINICSDKCELNYDTVAYPFEEFEVHDGEITVLSNEYDDAEYIEKWVQLEVEPEYLKMYL